MGFVVFIFVPAPTIEYTAASIQRDNPEETLEQKAGRIAVEEGIDPQTLKNLVWSESRWDPDAVGSVGEIGLVQVHPIWGIPDEQARDPEFALRWAAQKIANGESYYWTVCSCVKSVRVKVPDLPQGHAEDFEPNADMQTGDVLILEYNGTRHLAYKKKIVFDGIIVHEGNFQPCLAGERLITWQELNSNLIGFYVVPNSDNSHLVSSSSSTSVLVSDVGRR